MDLIIPKPDDSMTDKLPLFLRRHVFGVFKTSSGVLEKPCMRKECIIHFIASYRLVARSYHTMIRQALP